MSSSTRPVRLRFAPSPTGFLHIGGVRAALFNWLFVQHARREGKDAQFLLRIEDTDLERSEQRYTDDILASMRWLGLIWDEEPIYQSKRLEVYRRKTDELIAQGDAYICTCTEADVDAMRAKATAAGTKPKYDGSCREKKLKPTVGQPHVIRAKLPLTGSIGFDDLVRGHVEVNNEELDDFVLIRSNGATTYNFSCVIDDVESRISHVVRGDDHINNTPKQAHLYRFFRYELPKFAHLPMILGEDKKKLSKRHGAVSANLYRAEGYLPEAMINFLARIGWSHGDQEIFTAAEMIEHFSFDHVQKASGVFNTEKLNWINGEHIKRALPLRLVKIVQEDFSELFKTPGALQNLNTPLAEKIVALIQPKMKSVKEIADQLVPFCTPGVIEVDRTSLKWNKDPALKPVLQNAVHHALEQLQARIRTATNAHTLGETGLDHAGVDAFLKQICESHGIKLGDLAQPMRLALTGRGSSAAGLFDLLPILPFELVEQRLAQVRSW